MPKAAKKKVTKKAVAKKSTTKAANKVANKPSVASLVKTLNKYRAAYHNGEALVSDEEFDSLENELRRLDPENAYFKQVGAAVPSGRGKVKLPFPMPSLPKIKEGSADVKWPKGTKRLYVMPKLDGVSCMIGKSGKAETRLFTRGNGTVGQDISKLLSYPEAAKAFPKRAVMGLKRGEHIRGELMIAEKDFDEIKARGGDFSNTRNLMAGMLAYKDGAHPHLGSVQFIVHEIVWPKKSENFSAGLDARRRQGWNTVPVRVFKERPSVEALSAILSEARASSPFTLDGLVLRYEGDYPGFAVAFKGVDKEVQAKIKEIEWSVSGHGRWKPVAIFEKSVTLDGVKVSRATANNLAWVESRGLGPGARVSLARSNQVIPNIRAVLTKAKSVGYPPLGRWKWDDNKTEAILVGEDNAQMAKSMEHALKTLGIEGSKHSTLETLVASNFDVVSMLNGSSVVFRAAGLGKAQSDSLGRQIEAKRREGVEPEIMMVASRAFPIGWGKRVFTKLLQAIPYEKLSASSDVASVAGFGEVKAVQFRQGWPAYAAAVGKLQAGGWKIKPKSTTVSQKHAGKVVVFTGVRDPDLVKWLESHGGMEGSSVSKSTTMLVAMPGSDSVKARRAAALGIRVVTPEEARKILGFKP